MLLLAKSVKGTLECVISALLGALFIELSSLALSDSLAAGLAVYASCCLIEQTLIVASLKFIKSVLALINSALFGTLVGGLSPSKLGGWMAACISAYVACYFIQQNLLVAPTKSIKNVLWSVIGALFGALVADLSYPALIGSFVACFLVYVAFNVAGQKHLVVPMETIKNVLELVISGLFGALLGKLLTGRARNELVGMLVGAFVVYGFFISMIWFLRLVERTNNPYDEAEIA